MDNQYEAPQPQKPPYAQQPQYDVYGQSQNQHQQPNQPPQYGQYQQYQQQSYQYQYPMPSQPATPVPTYLTTGWKVLYVILGMIVPVIALLVAFVRSRNVPTGDAMLRESVKYMLIGLIVDAITGVLLLILGMGLAVSFVSML